MYVIAVRHRTEEYSGKERSLCFMIHKCSLLLALARISWQGSYCLYRDGRCTAVYRNLFHSQGRFEEYVCVYKTKRE
jgi:hypothetical protein